jgi:hypothetical protein
MMSLSRARHIEAVNYTWQQTWPFLAIMVVLFAIFLSSCAAPKSFEEGLLYGYGQNAALQKSAAISLQSGAISKADATRVQTMANQATAALDAATQVGCGVTPEHVRNAPAGTPLKCLKQVPQSALEQLSLANKVLEALQSFLNNMTTKK